MLKSLILKGWPDDKNDLSIQATLYYRYPDKLQPKTDLQSRMTSGPPNFESSNEDPGTLLAYGS